MAAIPSATLKELWRSGQEGRLSPWEVAKALAFREASKEIHDGVPDLVFWVWARRFAIGGNLKACVHILLALRLNFLPVCQSRATLKSHALPTRPGRQ